MSDTYNGWTNRETWLVNVWFIPESVEDVQMARDCLESEFNAIPNGCLKDMISLGAVNWDELEQMFQVKTCDDCGETCDDCDCDDDDDDDKYNRAVRLMRNQ